jgi:DMSO/TMAO reductase YedYZ molybdopterin-dependent catalytic subunit
MFIRRHKKEKLNRRMPPNQRTIRTIMGWGTDHPGIVRVLPFVDKADWSLKVDGEVETPADLSWEEFLALPQTTSVSDFHCVETWSVLDQKWEGALFRDLVKKVKPKPEGRFVWFECYDGYTTSLPLEDLMGGDVILAYRLNEEPLPQPLGGPMRLVVPHLYAYKSPMWIRHITFMKEKKLGYWESGIYSDTADPWNNDRYRRR